MTETTTTTDSTATYSLRFIQYPDGDRRNRAEVYRPHGKLGACLRAWVIANLLDAPVFVFRNGQPWAIMFQGLRPLPLVTRCADAFRKARSL